MSEQIPEVPETSVIPMELVDHGANPTNPFSSHATEIEISKAIDLNLLKAELDAESPHPMQLAIQHTPGEDQPDILYVTPVVDSATLRRIVDAHIAPGPVLPDDRLSEILGKLAEGKTLTTAELSLALTAALGVAPTTGS